MGCWSAENATNAYLKTLRMGQKAKEPDVAEFISALAAGNNAQLMVVACASYATASVLALMAAAHQTGGRVICILKNEKELEISKQVLGFEASYHVEFTIGEAKSLILSQYKEADFVLVDCDSENHEAILAAVAASRKLQNGVVVGYNALNYKGSWWSSCGSKTQLLPIGGGLLVTRIMAARANNKIGNSKRSSHWVVKVDKCTGEEHVFRVRYPQQANQIEASTQHS